MTVRALVQIIPPSPLTSPCFDFARKAGSYEKTTVVIACIGIQQDSDGMTHLKYACNRGLFCFDEKCRYSIASKHKKQDEDLEPVEPFG